MEAIASKDMSSIALEVVITCIPKQVGQLGIKKHT